MFLAGTAALLAVPRAVPVREIPEPAVRPDLISATLRADAGRAREIAAQATRGDLDHDVRALGDAVRAFGRAEADGDDAALERAHLRIDEQVRAALARSPDAVIALRSYQTRAFVSGMRAFEESGEASEDLDELAGNFARSAVVFRWYDADERRLLADDAVLTALYKTRWNDITGLTGAVFALTIDEQRAMLGFLIAHPAVAMPPLAEDAGPDAERARAAQEAVVADQRRLDKIRELSRLDPTYPGSLAEGVVMYRLGRFEAAAIAFERHLAASPDGPWTLRAQNYLKASLEAR